MPSHLDCCVFCLRCRGNIAEPEARTCTYGMGHEFPQAAPQRQPERPRDASLCVRCGLHPRNPASATNGCEHSYVAV